MRHYPLGRAERGAGKGGGGHARRTGGRGRGRRAAAWGASPRRLTAARARLLWAGALVVAAVALFWCYLLQSRTAAVNSDAAGMVLQGWDMMHGNLLLHGWFVADVSFSTFESR